MEQKPFAAFLDLINLDKKIHTIQKDILAMRQHLDAVRTKQDELTEKATQVQSHIDTLRVQISLQEKEMHEFDAQEKAKKKLLGTLSEYREVKAMQAEIDSLKRAQIESEQLIMQSWNKLEQAQKENVRIQGLHQKEVTLVAEELAIVESNILQQTHILNELLQQRPEKVALIPHEWLEHYEMMVSRVYDPLVAVEQESCGACFTSIAKQDMLRLQKKALLKCRMCFRFLFLPSVLRKEESP